MRRPNLNGLLWAFRPYPLKKGGVTGDIIGRNIFPSVNKNQQFTGNASAYYSNDLGAVTGNNTGSYDGTTFTYMTDQNPISVQAWFLCTAPIATRSCVMSLRNPAIYSYGHNFIIHRNSTPQYLRFGYSPGNVRYQIPSTSWYNNIHHVIFSYSGSSSLSSYTAWKIFVDSVQVSKTGQVLGLLNNSKTDNFIMAGSGGGSSKWYGNVYWRAAYSRRLTQQDATTNYNLGVGMGLTLQYSISGNSAILKYDDIINQYNYDKNLNMLDGKLTYHGILRLDDTSHPHVVSLIPNKLNTDGGTTANINGFGFSGAQGSGKVYINSYSRVVNSWADNLINITTPSIIRGQYDVNVVTNLSQTRTLVGGAVYASLTGGTGGGGNRIIGSGIIKGVY